MQQLPECKDCGNPVIVKNLQALADKGPRDIRDLFCPACWKRLLIEAREYADSDNRGTIGPMEVDDGS